MDKRVVCLVCLVVLSSLLLGLLVACGGSDVPFLEGDIVSVSLSYTNVLNEGQNISGTLGKAEDGEAIGRFYAAFKGAKFNKSHPKKDVWSKREIEYKRPNDGYFVTVATKTASYSYCFFGGKVYREGDYRTYSESGGGAHEHIRLALVEKQNKAKN